MPTKPIRERLTAHELRRIVFHLLELNDLGRLESILTDIRFIEARCDAEQVVDLLIDYQRTLNVLPESETTHDVGAERSRAIEVFTEQLIQANVIDKTIPPPQSISLEHKEPKLHHLPADMTRAERIHEFALFLEQHRTAFEQHGKHEGFVLQQALNSSVVGPVTKAAKINIDQRNSFPLVRIHDLSKDLHLGTFGTKKAIPTGAQYGALNCLDITLDASIGVTGGDDCIVRVFDLNQGIKIAETKPLPHRILDLAITPDGCLAFAGLVDGYICLIDIKKGVCLWLIKAHEHPVASVDISADGAIGISATFNPGSIKVWNLNRRSCVHTLHADGLIQLAQVKYSVTLGAVVACYGPVNKSHHHIFLWDVQTGQRIRKLQCHGVYSLDLQRAGPVICAGDGFGSVNVIDLDNPTDLRSLKIFETPIKQVCLSADGMLAAVSDNKQISLLRLDSIDSSTRRSFVAPHGHVKNIKLRADGMVLVGIGSESLIHVWETERIGEQFNLAPDDAAEFTQGISLVGGGGKAITGGDKGLFVWSTQNNKPRRLLPDLETVGIRPKVHDGSRLVSAYTKGNTLTVVDVDSGEIKCQLSERPWVFVGSTVDEKGQILVAMRVDGEIQVRSLVGLYSSIRLVRHGFDVDEYRDVVLFLLPSGRHLVSFGSDSAMYIWDIHSGNCINSFIVTSPPIGVLTDGVNILFSSPAGDFLLNAFTGERTETVNDSQCEIAVWRYGTPRGHLNFEVRLTNGVLAQQSSPPNTTWLYDVDGVYDVSRVTPTGAMAYRTGIGTVKFGQLCNVRLEAPRAVATFRWRVAKSEKSAGWSKHPEVQCPRCFNLFAIEGGFNRASCTDCCPLCAQRIVVTPTLIDYRHAPTQVTQRTMAANVDGRPRFTSSEIEAWLGQEKNREEGFECSACQRKRNGLAIAIPSGFVCDWCVNTSVMSIANVIPIDSFDANSIIELLSTDKHLITRVAILMRLEETTNSAIWRQGVENSIVTAVIENLGFETGGWISQTIRQFAVEACIVLGADILELLFDDISTESIVYYRNALRAALMLDGDDDRVARQFKAAAIDSREEVRQKVIQILKFKNFPWVRDTLDLIASNEQDACSEDAAGILDEMDSHDGLDGDRTLRQIAERMAASPDVNKRRSLIVSCRNSNGTWARRIARRLAKKDPDPTIREAMARIVDSWEQKWRHLYEVNES